MKFKVTLEKFLEEGKFAFAEIDDCLDEGELFDHCRREFPEYDVIYFRRLDS